MDLKYELLAESLNTIVRERVQEAFDDLKDWTDATSMVMLMEIREIIKDKEIFDSDKLERIEMVYKKHNAY